VRLVNAAAEAAGLVGAGMTSGLNMHRARHTFATDLRRVADLGAASQALGHSDLSTTASIYGHYDLSDLENAMESARTVASRPRRADRLK
jgi:integrase